MILLEAVGILDSCFGQLEEIFGGWTANFDLFIKICCNCFVASTHANSTEVQNTKISEMRRYWSKTFSPSLLGLADYKNNCSDIFVSVHVD